MLHKEGGIICLVTIDPLMPFIRYLSGAQFSRIQIYRFQYKSFYKSREQLLQVCPVPQTQLIFRISFEPIGSYQ